MIYCTLILVRRKSQNPAVSIGEVFGSLYDELWSVNGVFALILSIGAVFTAWNVQVYRNPTWGNPWPVTLVALATMAGAAAGAATVPMGLSAAASSRASGSGGKQNPPGAPADAAETPETPEPVAATPVTTA